MQEEANSPRVTLRSLYERVLARLAHWKARRSERMFEYEGIMVRQTCVGSMGKWRQQGAATTFVGVQWHGVSMC